MIRSYRTCAQTLKHCLLLGVALLLIVSTSVRAQPIKDVKKWLREFKDQLKQPESKVLFNAADNTQFALPQNIDIIDINPHQFQQRYSINDDNFDIKYRKVVKANREHIRRLLNRAVEVNIVNIKGERAKHRFYINTVKQHIVSSNHIGRLKYKLLLAEEETVLDIKYSFR